MLRYIKVEIRMSELGTQVKEVPAWEVPVLQSIHNENVNELEEVFVDRDTPEHNDEYQRLENLYRQTTQEDGSKGIMHVAAVYGQGTVGARALQRAIKDATVKEAPEGVTVKRGPKRRVKVADLIV